VGDAPIMRDAAAGPARDTSPARISRRSTAHRADFVPDHPSVDRYRSKTRLARRLVARYCARLVFAVADPTRLR